MLPFRLTRDHVCLQIITAGMPSFASELGGEKAEQRDRNKSLPADVAAGLHDQLQRLRIYEHGAALRTP